MDEDGYPHISPFRAGLGNRCPRCGEGRLFSGFLTIAPSCEVCGLDFSKADSGDGPAVFVIFLAGIIVVILMVLTEVMFSPPYWLQLVIWLPVIFLLSLGLLRPIKGVLVALQFHHDATQDIE